MCGRYLITSVTIETNPCRTTRKTRVNTPQCSAVLKEPGLVNVMLKHLLLNDVGGLIVEDGPQAMGVSSSFWIQAEVEGHKNRGEFISEVLLLLQLQKHIAVDLKPLL